VCANTLAMAHENNASQLIRIRHSANVQDNLLKVSEIMNVASRNFEATAEGILVCKALGNTNYGAPDRWKIEPGEYLTEVVNPCRTTECGCGVNFGTLEWCKKTYPEADLWKCLLEWKDLADTVVPYNTDGKARCGRLKLLELL